MCSFSTVFLFHSSHYHWLSRLRTFCLPHSLFSTSIHLFFYSFLSSLTFISLPHYLSLFLLIFLTIFYLIIYFRQLIPHTELECPTTRDALPMCVVSGRHMILDDWCFCPNSKCPALYSAYIKYIEVKKKLFLFLLKMKDSY